MLFNVPVLINGTGTNWYALVYLWSRLWEHWQPSISHVWRMRFSAGWGVVPRIQCYCSCLWSGKIYLSSYHKALDGVCIVVLCRMWLIIDALQTGSGKTYTMGTGFKDGCPSGIIPQVMTVLFGKIDTLKHQTEFQLHVSFIEVCEK